MFDDIHSSRRNPKGRGVMKARVLLSQSIHVMMNGLQGRAGLSEGVSFLLLHHGEDLVHLCDVLVR